MNKVMLLTIGGGGEKVKDQKEICPTLCAAYYYKTTYASHPTPYLVIGKSKSDKTDRKEKHE